MDNSSNSSNMETKRIMTFLAVTFIITYFVEIFVIGRLAVSADPAIQTVFQFLVASVMLIPSVGVVITRIITKEGFKNLWIKPNIKGNIKYYVFAWFGMIALTLIGAAIYFTVFPDKFDGNMTYLINMYKSTGQNVSAETLKSKMFIQVVMAIFLSPILNALFCFGEEWAWRGYLLPKMMKKFKLLPMLLINGVIWGLWHAPLTALGHNYGLNYAWFPFAGIFAMCMFCIVLGTIFSYLTIKTKSCIPAVIAHGSLNGFAAVATYFTVDGGNPFVGPGATGVVGGSAFIVTAVILYFLLNKAGLTENVTEE
ncbi:MAG: type II CAAX endopeptidase family protein [Sedimentibacter sp.]|uniref:CPBP family intramembrane glutamic endopeptidase n=1 Tax=Sedimentibacter sp. TaxID=1960295 RepID=UPI003158B263